MIVCNHRYVYQSCQSAYGSIFRMIDIQGDEGTPLSPPSSSGFTPAFYPIHSATLTSLRCCDNDLRAEGPCTRRSDGSDDTHVGGVGERSDGEGGGGGGQQEGLATPHDCDVDDVAYDHSIDVVISWGVPSDGD